jgi:hypothetical protein
VAAVVIVLGLSSAALAQDNRSEAVRPQVGKPLQSAQQLLKEQKFAEALERLKEVDGIADKTPYESFVTERLRGVAAAGAGDTAAAVKAFDAVVASGRLSREEKLSILQSGTATLYKAKDYAKAADWAKRYLQEGGTNPQIRTVLAQSLYLGEDYEGAARELLAQVQGDEAAGRAPAQEQLQLLASAYLKRKDNAGYAGTLEKIVAHYPTKEAWADLVDRTQRKPGFSDKLLLDVFRLQRATSGFRDASEVMEMAQLSLEAGYPIEAQAVMDEGYKAGLLGKGGDAARQKSVADRAAKAAAQDAKTLSSMPASKEANALAGAGLNLVLAGQPDKGIPLLEEALAKGGLKQPEETRLRLGMAYVLAGQKAKALDTLKAVQGGNGSADLARLWSLRAQRLGA